jgi:hypothetical protein
MAEARPLASVIMSATVIGCHQRGGIMGIYRTDPVPPPALPPTLVVADVVREVKSEDGHDRVVPNTAKDEGEQPPALPGAPLPTTGTADKTPTAPRLVTVLASLVAIGLITWAGNGLLDDPDYGKVVTRTVPNGLTIFAVFFVMAQGIERLLEPVSMWLAPSGKPELKEQEEKVEKAKTEAADAQHESLVTGDTTALTQKKEALQNQLDAAASKADTVEQWRLDRKVIFWAVASGVAVVVSAAMNVYLLRTVGISSAPRWMEILATGLIIGAGTKPLHDLVTLISAKATEAKS